MRLTTGPARAMILTITLFCCVGLPSCVAPRHPTDGGSGGEGTRAVAASLASALSPLVDGATVWAAASHPQYLVYADLARRLLGQLEDQGRIELAPEDLEQMGAILREYLAWTGKSHDEIEEMMRYFAAAIVLVQAFNGEAA